MDSNPVDPNTKPNANGLPFPERAEFRVDGQIKEMIEKAKTKFEELVDAHDVCVLAFQGFGKQFITKQLKLSPDAFMQMAIQLGYYKFTQKVVATYESASTRKFRYGRTEVCRTASLDSKAWVQAMSDSFIDPKVKGILGRKAVEAHIRYMAEAVQGMGVDRHLLGLRKVHNPETDGPLPAIFTNSGYKTSTHWTLSTSQLSSEYFDGYGWGEVVPDGFGVAYAVKNNSLYFNIASKKLGAHRFGRLIEDALWEMKEAFEATVPQEDVTMKPKL